MVYEEPERLRDLIADAVFDRSFDELTELEKEKVHNISLRLREVV